MQYTQKISENTKNEIKILWDAAYGAFQNAYAPYSKYHVGAALLCAHKSDESFPNELFAACNVENSSYGATICAERGAISQAVAKGYKKINKILVLTSSITPAPPCGICLQVLSEFAGPDTAIFLSNVNKQFLELKLKDLLPLQYSSKELFNTIK